MSQEPTDEQLRALADNIVHWHESRPVSTTDGERILARAVLRLLAERDFVLQCNKHQAEDLELYRRVVEAARKFKSMGGAAAELRLALDALDEGEAGVKP